MIKLGLRPATTTERQLAALWGAAAVSVLVLRPLWVVAAPFLRPCIFRQLTGIPCPTCGTTRTALALADLDLAGAFVVNPLATIAAVIFFVGGAFALLWVAVRWPLPNPGLRWTWRWTIALIVVVVINWSYLIATR